jgi:ElaB/YqjD/DUF883 family membrane-anchored ribosome-binding protein
MTSTTQLQREADMTRIGLAETLSQLRDGVAPSALGSEALALVKDTGAGLLKGLGDQCRANPMAALLIGAGLTMLLTRTTGGDVASVASSGLKSAASTGYDAARSAGASVAHAAGSAARSAGSSVANAASTAKEAVTGAASRVAGSARDAAADASDRVAETVGSTRERMTSGIEAARGNLNEASGSLQSNVQSGLNAGQEALESGRQRAAELADQAKSAMTDARQSVGQLIEEQPILMAALGAALGAAVGALLPLSKAEKDVLCEPAAKALDAGRSALSGAADVVRQEVSASDIGTRMGEIADEVIQKVTDDACGADRSTSASQPAPGT